MPIADLENPLIPGFDAIIDGSPLTVEAKTHVLSVTVDDSAYLPSMFALEIMGSDDEAELTAWIDNESLFAVGKAVEVKMGYAEDLETLIKGEITALEPDFACDRSPRLTVRGYDRRHRLQRGRKTRTFVQQKDSDIASQIASEAGLTAEATDSQVTHDYVFQANQSDLDFIQERARLVQFEVVVDDKKLIFRPVPNDQSEILTFTLSDHILEFYPRLTSYGQVGEVNVRGWSPKDKKEVIGKSKTGDENSTMGGSASGPKVAEDAFGSAISLMSAQPVMTQAEADQIAKARFNRRGLGFITGDGVCLGRTDLRAGKVIKIDGIGKRFSGQYYVASAAHRIDAAGGYRTHFSVRRSAS
jgi:phage protein D